MHVMRLVVTIENVSAAPHDTSADFSGCLRLADHDGATAASLPDPSGSSYV